MTMRVQIEAGGIAEIKADTIVIPITRRGERPRNLPQGLAAIDRRMDGRLSDALASGDFKAAAGDRLVVYGPQDGDLVRCIFLGLGEAEEIDENGLRLFGGRVGREAIREGVGRVVLVVPHGAGLAAERSAAVLAEGALLGAYRFDHYQGGKKKKPARSRPRLRIAYTRRIQGLSALRARVRRVLLVCESQLAARDLSNEPPNALYPETLARRSRAMARSVGLRCSVMNVPERDRAARPADPRRRPARRGREHAERHGLSTQ
jgi:leucyl aminopeptidase